jgi:hypothetical protein
MTLAEMLEANSIPEPNSGCLIWLRGTNGNGYPVARWEGRKRQVSHLALEAKGVEVPRGFMACHRCDNPFCINDDHLFVGTGKDNMADASAKGRLAYGYSEVCWRGHPMSGDNLRVETSGRRRCRACEQVAGRQQSANKKAARHARGLLKRGRRRGNA